MSFGYGDGGGGPTREMLENISTMKDFPSLPKMHHSTVKDFFENLEANAGDKLPVWNGELYLELHRGTYTTHSRNKRANRKSEFLLHDAEFVAALASSVDSDYNYPHATLQEAWQLVCLNQFHDILPGSSITDVYTESLEQYAHVKKLAETACDNALEVIAARLEGDVLVVNPTSFVCTDVVLVPDKLEAVTYPHQHVSDGTLLAVGSLPPYSVTAISLQASQPEAIHIVIDADLSVSEHHLENACLRVELDNNGDITRIYDKQNQREVVPESQKAGEFLAFEDRPNNWDAWDVDIFYDDKVYYAAPAVSISVIEQGPLRVAIKIERSILNSNYTQKISLCGHSARLDINTEINWQEKHTLLKAAFPVEVFTPVANYEIQWGQVQRPTHRNTSWDWARFETCAQKWVDLSEGDYGVSLLNDCKYGHDIQGNVMRVSLLRSPTQPDPHADEGVHTFTISVLPHTGQLAETTISEGYALNNPLFAKRITPQSDSGATQLEAVSVNRPNVVIETVKQAEDDSGIIVRLYESQRQRGQVKLTSGLDIVKAERTNLLEAPQESLQLEDNQVIFNIKPFEIVTLKLSLANA